LNSEIYINTDGRYPGRNRSRKRRKKKSILFPCIAAAGVLFVCAFFLFRMNQGFNNRYPVSEISKNLLTDSSGISAAGREKVQAFASDLCTSSGKSSNADDITAESGLLCGSGGSSLLYEKNAFEKLNPASTTKIMTCLIALEKGDLDKTVTVGNEIDISEAGVSLAGLKKGDKITLRQLLFALMLPSGGDAANAIAVAVSGSIDSFVSEMNDRAAKIGAVDTHFVNAEGLTDPGHYTTAYDMYLILHEAMKNDTFRKIAGTSSYTAEYTASDGSAVKKTWKNTNLYLIDKADEPSGLSPVAGKTGTTLAAGSCLALVSRTKSGAEYYSVILKASKRAALYDDMNILLGKIAQ